jgi:hypothetical protein
MAQMITPKPISPQDISEMRRIVIDLMLRSYIPVVVAHTSWQYNTTTGYYDGETIEWVAGFLDEHRLAFSLRRRGDHNILESDKLWEKTLPHFAPAWYKTLELYRRYDLHEEFTHRQQAILDLLERKYQDIIKEPVEITIVLKRLRDLAADREWQRITAIDAGG